MVCLGLEPGAAGWKAQTNPLSYGGTPCPTIFRSSFIYDDLMFHISTHDWIMMHEHLTGWRRIISTI